MLPKMTWSRAAGSKPVRASNSSATMRPRSAAVEYFSSVPAREYGVRRPSTMTTSRDMRLAGGLVHSFDQLVIAALDDAALDLQRRGDRAVLDRQVRRQDREGAELLVMRFAGVVTVDLSLKQGAHFRGGVGLTPVDVELAGLRPLAQTVEVRDDQRRQELLAIADHHGKTDEGRFLQL